MEEDRYHRRRYLRRRRGPDADDERGHILQTVVLGVFGICFGIVYAYYNHEHTSTKVKEQNLNPPQILAAIEPIPEMERPMPGPSDMERVLRNYIVEYYTMEPDLNNYVGRWKEGEFLSAVSSEDVFKEANKAIISYLYSDVAAGNGIIRRVKVTSMERKSVAPDLSETWEVGVLFSDRTKTASQENVYPLKITVIGRVLTLKEYKDHTQNMQHFKTKNPFGIVVTQISASVVK